MTRDEITTAALDVLTDIAPDADVAHLDTTASLQEQMELDSFDFLQFLQGLSQRLDIEIPERDVRQLATLDGCVGYVMSRLGARA